jgi:hypothetical protein
MRDDDDAFVCYGGAEPGDTHLIATVHCVDDEIIDWLAQRERSRARKTKKVDPDATRAD